MKPISFPKLTLPDPGSRVAPTLGHPLVDEPVSVRLRSRVRLRRTARRRQQLHRHPNHQTKFLGSSPTSSDVTPPPTAPHRTRLREQGLRPIQIWVPDVRSPQFAEQAHCQSLAVASSRYEADDQAFIDALADDE
jgi:hypothetical protein